MASAVPDAYHVRPEWLTKVHILFEQTPVKLSSIYANLDPIFELLNTSTKSLMTLGTGGYF